MDHLRDVLKRWLNFRPDKPVHVDTPIEPLVLDEDFHDDEAWFVIGMGENDG